MLMQNNADMLIRAMRSGIIHKQDVKARIGGFDTPDDQHASLSVVTLIQLCKGKGWKFPPPSQQRLHLSDQA